MAVLSKIPVASYQAICRVQSQLWNQSALLPGTLAQISLSVTLFINVIVVVVVVVIVVVVMIDLVGDCQSWRLFCFFLSMTAVPSLPISLPPL